MFPNTALARPLHKERAGATNESEHGRSSTMSPTIETRTPPREYLIIGAIVVAVVVMLPLLAVLAFMFQFAFVAIAPVIVIGGIAYAFASRAEPVIENVRGVAVPSDVSLYRGHGWARETGAALVIGFDDFAQRMLGPIATVALTKEGVEVAEGDLIATIERAGREIALTAPTSGIVTRINSALSSEPSLVNRAPYAQGWLVELSPRRPVKGPEVKKGVAAVRWMRAEVERLLTLVSGPLPEASLPDGGELGSDVSKAVDDRTWERLHNAFFA
jgi:glycine cleavage system H protein